MRIMTAALLVGLVLGGAFSAEGQDPGTITVDRMVVGTAVEEREPVGVDTTFAATVDEVVCFTELGGAAGSLSHRWYFDDELVTEVSLNKGAAGRWRTWSIKTVVPEFAGTWRVDVVDDQDRVLKSATFTWGR